MTAAKPNAELLKRRWSLEDDSILRRLYPIATMAEIAALLPGRTITSIAGRANQLQIVRSRKRPHPGKVVSPVFVQNGVEGKHCVKCLTWKPLPKFARHSTCAGGRRNTCTTCEGRLAYANNPEARIATVVRYQKNNPDKRRQHHAQRMRNRSERLKNGDGVTPEQIRELKEAYGGLCAYCRSAPSNTVDHVVPLARGGRHEIANILPACKPCNNSKHTQLLGEWTPPVER